MKFLLCPVRKSAALWRLSLLFSCFILNAASIVRAEIRVQDSIQEYDNFSIEYFYDAEKKQTLDSISKQNFMPIANQFALGYRDGYAWFRINIYNETKIEQFVLYFTEPFWTELDGYKQTDNGLWPIAKNGLSIALNERDIEDASPAYRLHIPEGSHQVLYFRGLSESSHIGEFILFTEKKYFSPGRLTFSDLYNLYASVLFFMMLFTGFLYFVVKEKLYLYYVGYVLSFIIWISIQNGHYLYAGFPGWAQGLHASGVVVVGLLGLFTQNLLNIKKHAPRINRLFTIFITVIFICGLLITLKIPGVNLIFNIISSVFFTLLLITAIQAWIKNYFEEARYYLISLIIYMPAMALMTLTYNGILPNNDFNRYFFAFGSFIEILFFSFILISRYNAIAQQKIFIQNELLREKEHQAQLLEQEVTRRTHALDLKNKQLEEAQKQLEIEATTDALSKLLNRRYFLKKAQINFDMARKNQLPLSLLMIDIDRFKGINDNFGHDTGDKAIVACAEVFSEHARKNDIVCRYGGEEFVILTPETRIEEAQSLAERIRSKVANNTLCQVNNRNISLTLSIGVTSLKPNQDKQLDDILKRADDALYQAKNQGRNNVIML